MDDSEPMPLSSPAESHGPALEHNESSDDTYDNSSQASDSDDEEEEEEPYSDFDFDSDSEQEDEELEISPFLELIIAVESGSPIPGVLLVCLAVYKTTSDVVVVV